MRGPLLAVLLVAGAILLRFEGTALEYLPLDSWMYAAAADAHGVFTARPWGYRLLGPALVSLTPDVRSGFAALMALSLCGAGLGLYLFLRRLGHGEAAALCGVALFAVSGPVAYSIRNPYVCEPLTACLGILFLLALASRAPLGALALLAALAALSKEIALGLLALVFLLRREERGWRGALLDAALVSAPALLMTALLRVAWTPQFAAVWGLPGGGAVPVLWERLGPGLLDPGLLLGGVLPLALVGACTARGRALWTTWAPLAVVYTLLPFSAWLYDPRPGRLPFFGETVHRLLIYALPLLLPLALAPWPGPRTTPGPIAFARGWNRLGWALAALLASSPLWALDGYRRGPLPERFNGPVVRALFGESLRAAAALDRGEGVRYELERELPGRATRRAALRFFLRGGWGSFPYLDPGPAVMDAARGELSIPAGHRPPRSLQLTLSAPAPADVRFEVEGRAAGECRVEAQTTCAVALDGVVRGDNAVLVHGTPGLRLHALALQPR